MRVTISTPTTSANYEMTKEGLIEITKMALLYSVEQEAKKLLDKTPEPAPETKTAQIKINIPSATKETAEAKHPLPAIKIDEPAKSESSENEDKRYSGFMIVECENCGKQHVFFAKVAIGSQYCQKCGHETKLHDMKYVIADCKCGSHVRYKTNSKQRILGVDCIKCQAPIDLELNERNNSYVTMREKRKHH